MAFTPADSLSVALFILFTLIMFVLCFLAMMKADAKVNQVAKRLVGPLQLRFVGVLVFFTLIVTSGLPIEYVLPVVPLMFVSILTLSVWFSFSSYGLALAQSTPLAILIGFQSFRFPLELILHHWADLGTVPPTMTWTGENIDIVSGLIAIPFAFIKNKKLAWIPTAIGFVLLLNVLRVVVMSSPFPFSWPLENPIQLILYLPYAYIGPLFVAPALIGHLVTIRKLRQH